MIFGFDVSDAFLKGLLDDLSPEDFVQRISPFKSNKQRNIDQHCSNGNLAEWNKDSKYQTGRSHKKKRKAQAAFGASTDEAKEPHVIRARNFITNKKKVQLLQRFAVICTSCSTNKAAVEALALESPATPVNTLLGFRRRREQIERSDRTGTTESQSRRSVEWLKQQQQGKFDAEEQILFGTI